MRPLCTVFSVTTALLLVCSAAAVGADEAVSFRYKIKKGDRLIYRSTTSMTQKQSFNNMNIETKITQTAVGVRSFEKIDKKGNFHVKQETMRLKVTVDIGPLGE